MNKQVGPTCWFEVFTGTMRAHVDNPSTVPGFDKFTAIKEDLRVKHKHDAKVKIKAAADANKDLQDDLKQAIKAEPLKRHHIALACFGTPHVKFIEPKKYTIASIGKQIQENGPFYASYYPYPKPNYQDDLYVLINSAISFGADTNFVSLDAVREDLSDESNDIDTSLVEEDFLAAINRGVDKGYLKLNPEKTEVKVLRTKRRDPPKGTTINIAAQHVFKKGKEEPKGAVATSPEMLIPWELDNYGDRFKLSIDGQNLFDEEFTRCNGRSWGTGAHAMLVVGVSDTNKCLYVRNPQDPTPLLAPKFKDFIVTGQEEGLVVGFSYKP